MYRKTVTLSPDRPNVPLAPVWIGKGSDALLILSGVPDGFTARVYLTKVGATVAVYFGAAVSADTGEVYVFIAGANFPTDGQGSYEIRLTETATGHHFWSGRGLVTVSPASSDTVTAGSGAAMETYVRNPQTGLYHKVTVSVNDIGELTTVTEQEGVDLA